MPTLASDLALRIVASTPAEFRRELETEIPRWKAVIDTAGISTDCATD